jgi:hypothetical protein
MNTIFQSIEDACLQRDYHAITILGNNDSYDSQVIGDHEAIKETLYFALTRDAELYEIVAESLRIASEVVEL